MNAQQDLYVGEFLKLSAEAEPGVFHNIGTGMQELGRLNPFAEGELGQHVKDRYARAAAEQAERLGNKTLSLTQKMTPAWETFKSTASKFKNPLMAAGTLGLATLPVAAGGMALARNLRGPDPYRR